VELLKENSEPIVRVRKVDWKKVIRELDALPLNTTVYVGVLDQSMRTHLKKGRMKYLNPDLYDIWTENKNKYGGNKADLFMRQIRRDSATYKI
jgi:hypothetical protein|tara:strand:+ start:472 stop:750 length:279 start_codon:yes stop_codon:yes gene_type:complete